MLSPRIETKRLILRRYKESDIDAIYEMITDDRLSKYIKYPKLTKEIVNELIEDILVHEDGVVDVIFKYQDEYENMVCYLESDGVIDAEKMDNWNVSKAFS